MCSALGWETGRERERERRGREKMNMAKGTKIEVRLKRLNEE